MVRQAQDERNQHRIVRPELVEGLVQRFLKLVAMASQICKELLLASSFQILRF
jgi:hypothetical protein